MTNQDAGTARTTSVPAAVWTVVGVVALLATWSQFILVHHRVALGLVLVAIGAGAGVLAHARGAGRVSRVIEASATSTVLAEVIWLIAGWYPVFVLAEFAAVTVAFACFTHAWTVRRRDRTEGVRRMARGALRGGAGIAAAVAALVSAVVLLTSVTPAPLIKTALQAATGAGNSFDPAAPMQTRVVNGTQLTNDIQYGTTYPNSYLDVYIADADPTVSRPTYVYVHGGGFIVGSKSEGDPNAVAGDSSFALGNGPVLEAGYNVVSIDYALAPQVTYPTPVVQLSQALAFLRDNGEEYGLDMSRVVLAGSSAGGHIAGQYAAIQTNPAYAAQLDVAPALGEGDLQAVVLDSALIDGTRGDRTQAPQLLTDWLFNLATRAYIGMDPAKLEEANLLDHITADFPPTFIADGNTGTFADQARDLSDELDQLGVRNELFLPTREQAILGHGFMAADSRWTDEYNLEKMDFLADVLG
jgi:acetyl esterase/lipase